MEVKQVNANPFAEYSVSESNLIHLVREVV